MPGLVVRKDDGELKWYPFFKQGEKFSFYPSKDYDQKKTGFKVGVGFHFEKYIPGYWIQESGLRHKRRIGGGNSLVVLEKDGDLKHYKFENETFRDSGRGERVGRGFHKEWDYYVAEWTGNGTSDLLVRDNNGRLRLFPWDGEHFEDLGRKEEVGHGFNKDKYPLLMPGFWTGGSTPDLLVREENGSLWVYPFNGETFKGQGRPEKVGRGFGGDFTHYLVAEWTQNGFPDLIVRKKNNELKLYRYGMIKEGKDHLHFADPSYPTVGRGFKGDWIYLVGHWREPGRPDLILCDDDHNMRFYPFDGEEFVDLDRGDKKVGKGWRFTHFWDFYPV